MAVPCADSDADGQSNAQSLDTELSPTVHTLGEVHQTLSSISSCCMHHIVTQRGFGIASKLFEPILIKNGHSFCCERLSSRAIGPWMTSERDFVGKIGLDTVKVYLYDHGRFTLDGCK